MRREKTTVARKITYSAILILVLMTVALVFFYRTIHDEEWAMRVAAEKTVTETTYMETIDRVETFIGEKEYRIVFGKDSDGREAIVWVDGNTAHLEYASSGVTEADVRQKVSEQNPANEIVRVMPGVLNGTYLWEVLYNRKEEEGSRYYYGYYRFDNGAEIDTWRMSKR
jgi:uncharacterized protein YpmB